MDLINIDEIIIGERFRKSPGDISDLIESIENIGLLHPIVIDSDYNLIAGHRRLLALRKLGETSIPCTIIDLSGKDKRKAEAEENTIRMDFTNSEIYAIQQYFHETESRQGDNIGENGIFTVRSESEQPDEKPIEKAAKATGKHPDTISKINQVMEANSDDPLVQKQIEAIRENIDKESVDKSYKEIKKLTKPEDDKPDPEFLIKLWIDVIKKQDEAERILKSLYMIMQYPEGAKLLKTKLSYYK